MRWAKRRNLVSHTSFWFTPNSVFSIKILIHLSVACFGLSRFVSSNVQQNVRIKTNIARWSEGYLSVALCWTTVDGYTSSRFGNVCFIFWMEREERRAEKKTQKNVPQNTFTPWWFGWLNKIAGLVCAACVHSVACPVGRSPDKRIPIQIYHNHFIISCWWLFQYV